MRGKVGPTGLLALTAALFLVLAFGASSANAAISIKKWESLTCKENKDLPENFGEKELGYENSVPELSTPPEQCTGSTLGKLFTQAAGHPNYGITDFRVGTYPGPPFTEVGGFPTAFVKDIIVETPEGLSVNPEALTKCTVAQLSTLTCPPSSLVGTNYLTLAAQSPSGGKCLPGGECLQVRVALPVYNLDPFEGSPSMVGFMTETGPVFIVGSLSPVDQHVIFTISELHPPSEKSPPIIESRLVFNGRAGNGTYLTMPSNCDGPLVSLLHLDSQGPPYEAEQTKADATYTTPAGLTGCQLVPFKPTIAVKPEGGAVDSPEPTAVTVGIPFSPGGETIANSYLKTAKVTLPEGMGINPSSANGLVPCTDAQFHYHTNLPIECPDASKVGTVEVETPSLPPGSLGGAVYVAEPKSNDPSTGEQFRIFIHVTSARYGVNVRLIGKVFPNLKTGQLTAVVDENPQATFSAFTLHFFGGAKGTLTTPGTCGPHTTTTEMTPWSENPDENKPTSAFTLTTLPEGGGCPATLAERPFKPTYSAKSDSTEAGKYSPLRVHIARTDGQQELKVVDVTLPKGLTGKLAGIPYCPDSAIAAAEGRSGTAEMASSSCGSASQIGTTTTAAGTGSGPIKIDGKAYLAGPYKGAPLSLAMITPAVTGPYDLGTVVVRVALRVNPETAQVQAVSDVIPHVFGGVKLDLRSIDVNVDRTQFMLNPTNCAKQATVGTINGGGANPLDPAAFSAYPVNDPFQATKCGHLGFKPKLNTTLLGPTGRAKNPRIRAILKARKGDANLARVALNLPHAVFLDQSHIRKVCTRVQLAAHECPKAAIYGHAKARTPLLTKALKGPVYLVSSKHTLPDLVADLRGQVNIQLHGVISSKHGGMKTVFNHLPDVPVTTFVLNMEGGKKSLLTSSTNLCEHRLSSVMNLKGQNGKKVKKNQLPLKVKGCK